MNGVSILGIPHDENSSFLKGAADAPPKIRAELFSDANNLYTETRVNLATPGLITDHGDIDFPPDRDSWNVIGTRVSEVLNEGRPLICLGGDHAISHPIVRAVHRRHSTLTLLHFDAHPDIYDDFQKNPRSHASPFARIMEQGLADRLIQVGIRTATAHQREQMQRFGVEAFEASSFRDDVRMEFSTPVYISLDIDAIDPAYAPGVSHRESGGLSPRQIIRIIQSIRTPIVAADIVEYNPRRDIADLTASVASKLLKEIAGMMVTNS
jgi:Arginase/agmatinase/formimionoglutamate hydrolase, arginase family